VEKAMKANKIPEMDSVQELARFWDKHEITDFEDDLEEVSEPVFQRAKVVVLHLEPNEADRVEKLAKSKGVSNSDLVREWVLEHIHK
jgi:predicted phosphatase